MIILVISEWGFILVLFKFVFAIYLYFDVRMWAWIEIINVLHDYSLLRCHAVAYIMIFWDIEEIFSFGTIFELILIYFIVLTMSLHPYIIYPYKWNWYHKEILILKENKILFNPWPKMLPWKWIEIMKVYGLRTLHESCPGSLCWKSIRGHVMVVPYYIYICIASCAFLFICLLSCIYTCIIYSCLVILI